VQFSSVVKETDIHNGIDQRSRTHLTQWIYITFVQPNANRTRITTAAYRCSHSFGEEKFCELGIETKNRE